ncbi:MAG: carbohydrate kinase family protein, partial [Acidobacteriota bacterium]
MGASLTVIGGASLDTLHFQARTVRSAGGAGLYTALAAQRAGARVTMLGPRPKPMPTELAEAARRLDWRGATVPPEQLPSFEIVHMGDGRSEMRAAHWRAEAELSVDDLPPDLPPGMVYCIPLTDPERQLEFIRHVKALGHPVACGTYAGAAADHPDVVHRALAATDAFFCNESEAISLFGDLGAARTRPGKLLFVTRSARGVRILQGDHATDLPAETAAELDPTGAGDTFCGTTLAHLASGAHPLQAARQAIITASEMVTDIGPAALLRPPKGSKSGSVSVDSMQVRRVAGRLAELPEIAPFPFTGDDLPPVGHPAALDYFFAATLQQFGFWTAAGDRYQEPWVAQFGGRRLKGSDYLWAAYCHWLDEDPTGLAPVGQSRLDAETLERR